MAEKGHLVVYSSDNRRLVIPLVYLNNEIFRELLQMFEEFGIQNEGPIILPCDSCRYLVCLTSGALAAWYKPAKWGSNGGVPAASPMLKSAKGWSRRRRKYDS